MKKQQLSIIILSSVLVILIAVAALIYNSLSKDYLQGGKDETTTQEVESSTAQATVEEEVKNTTADFTVTDKDGKEVKLSDYFGKPIVVNFWATWCNPCTSEMPHFEEAYKQYGKDIVFLMVNVGDTAADAYSYANSKGYTFPVFHDSNYNASIVYGVSSIPMTLFINSDGTLADSRIGMLSQSALEAGIKKIIE